MLSWTRRNGSANAGDEAESALARYIVDMWDANRTWDDVDWLRSISRLPLVKLAEAPGLSVALLLRCAFSFAQVLVSRDGSGWLRLNHRSSEASQQPLSPLVENLINSRDHDERENGRGDNTADHSTPERRAEVRAFSQAQRDGDHAGDQRKRRHHDRS